MNCHQPDTTRQGSRGALYQAIGPVLAAVIGGIFLLISVWEQKKPQKEKPEPGQGSPANAGVPHQDSSSSPLDADKDFVEKLKKLFPNVQYVSARAVREFDLLDASPEEVDSGSEEISVLTPKEVGALVERINNHLVSHNSVEIVRLPSPEELRGFPNQNYSEYVRQKGKICLLKLNSESPETLLSQDMMPDGTDPAFRLIWQTRN